MNALQTRAPRSYSFRDDTRITARELRLAETLGAHHLETLSLLSRELAATTRQVEALVFTSGTPLSRARTCRRVLRELADAGLADSERPPAGGSGGGSSQAVWGIAPKGERVLARREGREPARVVRLGDRGEGRLLHHLELVGLRVAVTKAGRAADIDVRWIPEPACWWRFASGGGAELLKPDARAEVGTRMAWLELDRGTQSVPTTIQAKVRRYCRAARACAAAGSTVPFVVFASTKPARAARLRALVPVWTAREDVTPEVTARLFHVLPPAAVPNFFVEPSHFYAEASP